MMGERFFCALTVAIGGGAIFALIDQLMEAFVWS